MTGLKLRCYYMTLRIHIRKRFSSHDPTDVVETLILTPLRLSVFGLISFIFPDINTCNISTSGDYFKETFHKHIVIKKIEGNTYVYS